MPRTSAAKGEHLYSGTAHESVQQSIQPSRRTFVLHTQAVRRVSSSKYLRHLLSTQRNGAWRRGRYSSGRREPWSYLHPTSGHSCGDHLGGTEGQTKVIAQREMQHTGRMRSTCKPSELVSGSQPWNQNLCWRGPASGSKTKGNHLNLDSNLDYQGTPPPPLWPGNVEAGIPQEQSRSSLLG